MSELNDKDANNLSLPPKVPYILDLKHKGTLFLKFSMSADWLDLNGQYIVGSEQVGCILEHGSKVYRTFDPFYSIISKINLISEITEKKNFMKFGVIFKIIYLKSFRSLLEQQTQLREQE